MKSHQPTESVELIPGLGSGFLETEGWFSLTQQPLLILVGLTGVGKTTLVKAVSNTGLNFTLLPNRRHLTDQFIIPTVREIDQVDQLEDLTCRITRFRYTRRYKQLFPAGMVQVLSQLQINPDQLTLPLLFDGLRGEQELQFAVTILPQAQFLVLEASNYVRLQRLLTRNDAFDSINQSSPINSNSLENQISSWAQLEVSEAGNFFSHQQATEIFTQVNQGYYSITELRDRLKIIVEEQRNYDPLAASKVLEEFAPSRTLFVDTNVDTPDVIAQKVRYFWR